MNNKLSSLAPEYNQCQLVSLTLLRLLIGWHLLYEGMAKLSNANWTSAAYLLDSKWIFSGLAKIIVSNPIFLTISDYGNMWGLTIIGMLLMIGFFGIDFYST